MSRSDDDFFREMDGWMVVCRDKYTGEIVGFNNKIYSTRASALADRRVLVGLREAAVKVSVRKAGGGDGHNG